MHPILKVHFERLKSLSCNGEVSYRFFQRPQDSSLPFSVHLYYQVSEGVNRSSWGSGITKDEAFGKALMEMIERLYFSGFSPFSYRQCFGILKKKQTLNQLASNFEIPLKFLHPANTNGVSAHLSFRKAKESALLELIERHTILYALMKSIGPDFRFKKEFYPHKTASFFSWKGPLKSYVTVGAYFNGEGTYYSSGSAWTRDESVKKADLELNSFLFLNEESPKDFKIIKDEIQSFNRYHRFSGDHSALNFFETAKPGEIPDLKKERFYFTKLPSPEVFKNLPILPVVRVIHPDVQQLFFDNWNQCYLNPRIFPMNLTLPSFPHIIA